MIRGIVLLWCTVYSSIGRTSHMPPPTPPQQRCHQYNYSPIHLLNPLFIRLEGNKQSVTHSTYTLHTELLHKKRLCQVYSHQASS